MKKLAKEGQMGAVRIMAKDLVRIRANITKFYKMKTELQAVNLKITTMKSHQQMAESMAGVTRIMGAMNKRMNLPAMQKIMMNFERENEKMDMKQEMMSDTMDDIFEGEDEEEETDQIVNQVLDEIGINLSSQLAETPSSIGTGSAQKTGKTAAPVGMGGSGTAPSAPSGNSDVDDLQSRLDNLRK